VGAVRWVVSVGCAVLGLAAIGWAVLQAPPARAAAERGPLRPIELRTFPGFPAAAKVAPRATGPLAAGPAVADDEPEPLRPLTDAGTVAAPPSTPDAGPRPVPGPGARPAVAPAGDGTLSLSASDTADIYLDGKKVGSSPMRSLKVKAGPHKVRFDCYDAAGNAVTGQVKVVTVAADQDQAVTYPCPESQ